MIYKNTLIDKVPTPQSAIKQQSLPDLMVQEAYEEKLLEQAAILVSRLERISADSVWAHRSSGLRGSLLRLLESWDADGMEPGAGAETPALEDLTRMIEAGFSLLENAARAY